MGAEGVWRSRSGALKLIGLFFGGWWVACAPPGEVLVLPNPPEDAKSVFLWTPKEAHAAAVPITAGVLPPLTARADQSIALLYSRASLEEMQLEAGALAPGGTRELVGTLAIHERNQDQWLERARVADLTPALSNLRLPAFDPDACSQAGGCSGLLPELELCFVPCACPPSLQGLPVPWSIDDGCTIAPAPRQQTCYQGPRLFTALNALGQSGASAELGQVVQEGTRTWAYFHSNHFAQPVADGTLYIYPAKIELSGPDQINLATASHLPIMELPSNQGPYGWTTAPRIRADGLELFLSSSVPDGNWNDEELFAARRPNLESNFGPMVPIAALTNANNAPTVGDPGDEARLPLLFPDFRTLIFRRYDQEVMQIFYARRPSDRSGDLDFVTIEGANPYGSTWAGYGLSRDLSHLLAAVRIGPAATDVTRFYALPITSLSPEVRYGEPVPLTLADGRTPIELPDPWWDMLIAEHPDGTAIYVSKNNVTWILDAVACE
ncbi:MAG: hypothetical protein IPG45_22630 [Deltaproteobacteria bacterium]|jgi:hypothetical protein|nr:hypothetical protein [Deltaproteobacteria bacterium]